MFFAQFLYVDMVQAQSQTKIYNCHTCTCTASSHFHYNKNLVVDILHTLYSVNMSEMTQSLLVRKPELQWICSQKAKDKNTSNVQYIASVWS